MSAGTTGGKWRCALNTSTLRGHSLPLIEVIEIAAKAGYDGIEPWIDELDRYVGDGGSLSELRRRIQDHGLKVENAIGFFNWIDDSEETRRAGLEEAKRNLEMVAQLGGTLLAAPPFGATERDDIDLLEAAKRYRTLLEAGAEIGVRPVLELWGFSRTLSRLGEVSLVAIETGHPEACLLLDVYHLYRGGSGFEGLSLLNGDATGLFHVNDYPALPAGTQITDADRVFPGEGVAPLATLVATLQKIGYRGAFSLELFNPEYYRRDPRQVAVEGLKRVREMLAL